MSKQLLELMNDSTECKNIDKGTSCEILQYLIKSDSVLIDSPSLELEAYLIATGLCSRVMNRIEKYYAYYRTYAGDYIRTHPVFKSKEEKNKFKIKMKRIENGNYYPASFYKGNKGGTVTAFYINKIKDILKGIIGDGLANTIAYCYAIDTIKLIDVAKCMVIYLEKDTIYNIENEKEDFESLTEEEGFDINVEELL